MTEDPIGSYVFFPQGVIDEIDKIAHAKSTTSEDVIKRCIKLGLVVAHLESKKENYILVRDPDNDKWKRLEL